MPLAHPDPDEKKVERTEEDEGDEGHMRLVRSLTRSLWALSGFWGAAETETASSSLSLLRENRRTVERREREKKKKKKKKDVELSWNNVH